MAPELYLSAYWVQIRQQTCTSTYLLHLPEDDLPLPLNGAVVQVAGLQNVGQDGDGLAHVLLGHLQIGGSTG